MIGGRGRRKRSGVILRKKNGRTQHKKLLYKTVEQDRKIGTSKSSLEVTLKTDIPLFVNKTLFGLHNLEPVLFFCTH